VENTVILQACIVLPRSCLSIYLVKECCVGCQGEHRCVGCHGEHRCVGCHRQRSLRTACKSRLDVSQSMHNHIWQSCTLHYQLSKVSPSHLVSNLMLLMLQPHRKLPAIHNLQCRSGCAINYCCNNYISLHFCLSSYFN